MRLLVIGDIHGCATALAALLTEVQPGPEDWLLVLGDYIDRGPHSRQVMERLLQLSDTGRLVALLGNHEQMLLEAQADRSTFVAWQQSAGGQATLDSYAPNGHAESFSIIPTEHWDFWRQKCIDYFETDTHFFVHAGADPCVALAEQCEDALRWEKLRNPAPHFSGKIMVCGHTPQTSGIPLNLGHAICIDTYAYGRGGWLTCLEPATGHYWQANEQGEVRSGILGSPTLV